MIHNTAHSYYICNYILSCSQWSVVQWNGNSGEDGLSIVSIWKWNLDIKKVNSTFVASVTCTWKLILTSVSLTSFSCKQHTGSVGIQHRSLILQWCCLHSRMCAHQSMRLKSTFVSMFHALARRARLLLLSPSVVSHIKGISNPPGDRQAGRQTGEGAKGPAQKAIYWDLHACRESETIACSQKHNMFSLFLWSRASYCFLISCTTIHWPL